MVEISGLATGPYTMLAPITGRPCYYFRTLVWEWKQHGKNKQWVKIAGECMHVPFFLDDNTGRMLIDPRGADLDLHRDYQEEFCDSFFTTKEPAPENVHTFLARHGVVTNNKIKVEEFCIKPKNALFTMGTVAENTELEVTPQPIRESEEITSVSLGRFSLSLTPTGFNSCADNDDVPAIAAPAAHRAGVLSHEIVRLPSDPAPQKSSEMTQQQKVAAALIKAGITSPAAWSAAGLPSESASAVQVISNAASASPTDGGGPNGFDRRPPVVLKKGENNTTFLISWRSQQEVARSLAWKCTLMIWGGPALALLSLYVLLSMTRVIR